MIVEVVLEPGEQGGFVAHCPSLKSCWSQGRTREEALENIKEAIELYLGKRKAIEAICLEFQSSPDLDTRSPETILGYDAQGLL